MAIGCDGRRLTRSKPWPRASTSSSRRPSSTAAGSGTPTSFGARTLRTGHRSGAAYHYEVADTKLARHVKAGAVLQICSYVEQLTAIQGVQPEEMHVVLGGSARETAHLRVDDYMAYYRAARARFEATVLGTDGAPALAARYPPADTYPEPVEHCDVCRWAELCRGRRREDDHLSLVAGITARQRKALVARELQTVERLAAAPIPFDPPLDGTSASSVERVREQARIQVEGRGLPKPIHELLLPPPGEPIDHERGLAILPEPDPGDLFLDLEGDPYAFDDGVDYLFGVMDVEGGIHRILVIRPRPAGGRLPGRREARVRAAHRLHRRAARAPPEHARLPLRLVRADRAQAAHGPARDARGGGGPAPARRRARRSLPGGAAGPARLGRELLDQADRGAL